MILYLNQVLSIINPKLNLDLMILLNLIKRRKSKAEAYPLPLAYLLCCILRNKTNGYIGNIAFTGWTFASSEKYVD